MIKGVFFDFFGTLVIPEDMNLTWSSWYPTIYPIYKKNGIDIDYDIFISISKTFWSTLYDAHVEGLTPFESRLSSQFSICETGVSTARLKALAYDISDAWFNEHYLDIEAVEILSYFKRKMKTALITNFDHPPFIHIMLERYKIRNFFDSVIISGELGIKKPMPEIFNPALYETGLSYNDVIYVGDSIIDLRAALHAGILPIIIRREGQHDPSRPGNVETDFDKLDNELNELFLNGQIEIISKLSDVERYIKNYL